MYTSDIERKPALKSAFIYIIISIVCALFGAVYEHFGHGVYSYFMIYAFLFPLAGGALPMIIITRFIKIKYPGTLSRYSYHSGIAVLTVGSLFEGVLDIYGTSNSLMSVYWTAAAIFITVSIIAYIVQIKKSKQENSK